MNKWDSNETNSQKPEYLAMLVYTSKDHGEIFELASAADFKVRQIASQVLESPSRAFYLGSGKVKEIQETLQEHPEIQSVIFDTDLTALQVRNLEEAFDVSVVDRSDLILQIFLQRASSAQAKLQVQNAILKRSKNRLTRKNINFSRQGGGMKNKGAGETQLELDRRNIDQQISNNERELKKLEKQREVQRQTRRRSAIPLVSLAGYTNVGKSTILNGLLRLSRPSADNTVLEKDQLFATLDSSVRRIERPLGRSYLLSDTVGFISNLPHHLVQGFKTTLEEIALSDLILVVADASSVVCDEQLEVVKTTLDEINASKIDQLLVRNKADDAFIDYPVRKAHSISICARDLSSLELLSQAIEEHLFGAIHTVNIDIPWKESAALSSFFADTEILEREDDEHGIHAKIRISEHLVPKYQFFIQKNTDYAEHAFLQDEKKNR